MEVKIYLIPAYLGLWEIRAAIQLVRGEYPEAKTQVVSIGIVIDAPEWVGDILGLVEWY